MLEHAEQLITRDALFEAVWPWTFVSDAALTVCIHELRQLLGDQAQNPQFIETVRGRGYRFLVPVTATSPVTSSPLTSRTVGISPLGQDQPLDLIGRQAELAHLHQRLATALQGERQMVFIAGEAGIGKTSLADTFLAQVATQERVWIGHGQCIDLYGAGEAYLPLLEILSRWGRASDKVRVLDLLHQRAPSWLMQLPTLIPPSESEAWQQRQSSTTPERMLRELAEALETLSAEWPLVLVFEDLHWSDVSTLDWLSYVARRRDRARLLIVGTYRPVEAIARTSPLRHIVRDVTRLGSCQELLLEYLTENEVALYLAKRLGRQPPTALARMIHQRTNGNPLFMVTGGDEMMRQDILSENADEPVHISLPENLRQLIEQQLEQLSSEELEMLETASVAGAEFSAAAIATSLNAATETVEAQCDALSRRIQFVQARGVAEWPDGTVAARYGFIHTLYQEVLYDRISAGRRTRLHQQIGLRREMGSGDQTREIAAELALHFVRGRDIPRAVQYAQYAGENAVKRNADQEAIPHLNTALKIIANLPPTAERMQRKLTLLITLGTTLTATKGWSAPELEQLYARALELCHQVGETPQLFPALRGLRNYYMNRGEWQTARQLSERMLALAQSVHDPSLVMHTHIGLSNMLYLQGTFAESLTHIEHGIALYNPQRRHADVYRYGGQDPGVVCIGFSGWVLWYLGYPEQARQRCDEALVLARELAHPYSLTGALFYALRLHQLRQDIRRVKEQAEAAVTLAMAHGFNLYVASGTILRGWALVKQGQYDEGLAQLRQGMAARQATQSVVGQVYFRILLADAYGHTQQPEIGLKVLDEALVLMHQAGALACEASLYRLKGTLLRQSNRPWRESEACFEQAMEVARRQQAKSLELQAATSLAYLRHEQGKHDEARNVLTPVYAWFTEGFDTVELRQAKACLEMIND